MHGKTTDTLFCLTAVATVWEWKRLCDTMCLCVYKGERNRGGKQAPGQLAQNLSVSRWVC